VQGFVNPDILLAPLEAREAVLSSRIEGTRASLEDVLAFEPGEEALITTARAAEIQEVNNYRRAMRQAETELSTRSIGINVLRERTGRSSPGFAAAIRNRARSGRGRSSSAHGAQRSSRPRLSRPSRRW